MPICQDVRPLIAYATMMLPLHLLVTVLLAHVAEPFDSANHVLDVHFQDQCTERCPFQVSNLLFIKDVLKSSTCSSSAELNCNLVSAKQ